MVLYVGTGDKAGGKVEEMQRSGSERREAAEERKGNDAEEKIGVDGEKSRLFR